MVNKILADRIFANREDLWSALQDAFSRVTSDQIKALYASMPSRLEALYKARGGYTPY